MVTVQRSALLVGFDASTAEQIADELRRVVFFCESVDDVDAALDLTQLLPFDAVIVCYPVVGMAIDKFLTALRRKASPCRQSAVAVVAPADRVSEATELIGHGANGVVSRDDLTERLAHMIFHLVEVPPRFSLRAVSRLKVQLGHGTSLTLCQTENVSATGMLLRTEQNYPIGTRVAFEMMLPGKSQALRGTAVVVRHTYQPHEKNFRRRCAVRGISERGPDTVRRTSRHACRSRLSRRVGFRTRRAAALRRRAAPARPGGHAHCRLRDCPRRVARRR